jgi:eukaryotic-like serine/threonine-protein kinase
MAARVYAEDGVFPGEAVGGRFVIEAEAASGGMATVYLAWLLTGRVDKALTHARAASAMYDGIGLADECHALVPLVLHEALAAARLHEEATRVLLGARATLLARAHHMSDERLRRSFLADVPDHARTLALARAVVVDGASSHWAKLAT